MSSNRPTRAHATLRRATAAAHHALDHHPLMQRLTGSDLTREQYAESLAAMYRPHVRLEWLVHQSRQHVESGFPMTPRVGLLEADLLELDWPVPPAPLIAADPADDRAAWWGSVYVLEGSRHGGAVIARRLRSSLGHSVPCRFFGEPMPADLPRALLARLEQELEHPDDLEQAVASARKAFGLYASELENVTTGNATSTCGRANST